MEAAIEAEIDTAVRCFGEAFAVGDVATLDTMLTPTFAHIDFRGRLTNRAAWLATVLPVMRRRPNTSTEIDDIAIRLFGEIAIVTARQSISYDDGPERRCDAYRFTSVLI